MDLSKLLGHLQANHDAPDDGRDFVAFEKRPAMIAASVKPETFDGFDFGSKSAVQNAIEAVRTRASHLLPRNWMPVAEPPNSERDNIIAGKADGRIDVATNPKANGQKPWYEMPGASMVKSNEPYIVEMAGKHGVDPNLLRATMYQESTHGYYDALPRQWDADGSILPMNINTDHWGETFGSRKALKDPRANVEAGATMLHNIVRAMPGASIAQIGSVYQNSQAKKVTDYGARVQAIYQDKPWKNPAPPKPRRDSMLYGL
jgi:hypothetical protein